MKLEKVFEIQEVRVAFVYRLFKSEQLWTRKIWNWEPCFNVTLATLGKRRSLAWTCSDCLIIEAMIIVSTVATSVISLFSLVLDRHFYWSLLNQNLSARDTGALIMYVWKNGSKPRAHLMHAKYRNGYKPCPSQGCQDLKKRDRRKSLINLH